MKKTLILSAGLLAAGLVNAQNVYPPTSKVIIQATEDQTVLGSNALSAIRISNGYTAAFGRRSELQFALSASSNETLAVIAGEYSSYNSGLVGGDLVFGARKNTGLMMERMRIMWNGNVGIGTNAPAAKLDIFGNNATTTNLILSADYSDRFRWRMKTVDRGNTIDMDLTASDNTDAEQTVLTLTHPSSTRPEFKLINNTIVANDGNVGIGTANTSAAKLTVAGDINSREVRVTVDAGADFVFENNYDLKSLVDIEQFIKVNKHLPEIASAEEMKTNGIQLGEMNVKLLQKVEELTLYMIEFRKEMESMKAENEALKSQISNLKR